MCGDRTRRTPALIDLAAQRRRIGGRIDQAIAAVLNHGQFILGPEVSELEGRLADFCGARHCISCASGTDALQLILMAEEIGHGDAVFVPAFTFVATVEVVVLAGATPVFVDVDRDTFNISPSSLEAAICEAKRRRLIPRGVVAVDLFGQPANYKAIRRLAELYGLTLIADAAQSLGASLNGHRVGTLAAYTATSFYPTKPLGCYGDGGAVFTNDKTKAKLLRCLCAHGKEDRGESVCIGRNSRLDTIQAAILLEKLSLFPLELLTRQANAQLYTEKLSSVVQTPTVMAGATSVWAQYTIISEYRDDLANACCEVGIPTAIYYPLPLHFQAAYRDYPASPTGLANSEWLTQRVISFPMHAYLTHEAVDLVIRTVTETLNRLRRA